MLVSTLALPGHPEHVRAARAFTALVLAAHSRDDDGTAGLLVSELVTNSLLHSDSAKPGGIITVTVALSPGETFIQVTDDGGPSKPTVRPSDGTDSAEDGRGLHLIGELSAGWGYHRRGDRLVTWFELDAKGHDMNEHDCACGYQAASATDLQDHLGEAFITDDIAPDGQLHAETGTDGRTCVCGYTATTTLGLDDHLLSVFTPEDGIAKDGTKHGTWHTAD